MCRAGEFWVPTVTNYLLRDGDGRRGDIRRVGRAPNLIIDHAKLVPLCRQAEHRTYEICPEGRIDPRRPQDDMPGVCCGDGQFSLKLGLPIDASWIDGVALDIGGILSSVENLIPGQMDDGHP